VTSSTSKKQQQQEANKLQSQDLRVSVGKDSSSVLQHITASSQNTSCVSSNCSDANEGL
jgi:hypothetical protein